MKIAIFLHILGVILWAGGVLNLSSMLVFHVGEEAETQARISPFEVRLFFVAIMPGLLLTVAAGLYMISNNPGLLSEHWMQAKLALVLLFFIFTMQLGKRIMLLRDEPVKSSKGPQMVLHSAIGLCVVAILFLVIVQPF